MIAGSRQEGLRLLPSAGCSRGRWYAQSLSTSALCVWVDAGGSPPSTVHERGVPHAGMKGRGRRWKPAPRPVSRAFSRSGEKAPRAQSQVLGFVFQIFDAWLTSLYPPEGSFHVVTYARQRGAGDRPVDAIVPTNSSARLSSCRNSSVHDRVSSCRSHHTLVGGDKAFDASNVRISSH